MAPEVQFRREYVVLRAGKDCGFLGGSSEMLLESVRVFPYTPRDQQVEILDCDLHLERDHEARGRQSENWAKGCCLYRIQEKVVEGNLLRRWYRNLGPSKYPSPTA